MSRYKLYYFNEKGRGEIIRLIFAAAGQKYEDIRIDDPDWPEFKQKAPFGQVPFLEVTYNGKILKIAQSLTISRFLARKFDLAGKTLEEQVEVEMYGDQIDDLLSEIFRVQYEKDGAKKEESVNKLYEETIPYYFKIFDEIVGKNNGFFTSGLTWADLFMMHLIESLNDRNDKILTNFFNLKTLYEKVRQNKKIAEWIAKRPQNQI